MYKECLIDQRKDGQKLRYWCTKLHNSILGGGGDDDDDDNNDD